MGTISNSVSLRSCSKYPRSRAFGCPLTGLWEIRHRYLAQGERQGGKLANGMEAAVLCPPSSRWSLSRSCTAGFDQRAPLWHQLEHPAMLQRPWTHFWTSCFVGNRNPCYFEHCGSGISFLTGAILADLGTERWFIYTVSRKSIPAMLRW